MAGAYNLLMINTFRTLASQAVLDRLTLFINHVLQAEPVAMQRLQAHVGRHVQLELSGWPSVLPAMAPIRFCITPAGLLEQGNNEATAVMDLRVSVDASNPARAALQALGGRRPHVDVSGDAAFAADLNWLFDNLRWDVADDLARVVGPVPAREIVRLSQGVASGLQRALHAASGFARRRSGAGGEPHWQ
jgi:ubiquinone biosynthesis accessory factor UbiJ